VSTLSHHFHSPFHIPQIFPQQSQRMIELIFPQHLSNFKFHKLEPKPPHKTNPKTSQPRLIFSSQIFFSNFYQRTNNNHMTTPNQNNTKTNPFNATPYPPQYNLPQQSPPPFIPYSHAPYFEYSYNVPSPHNIINPMPIRFFPPTSNPLFQQQGRRNPPHATGSIISGGGYGWNASPSHSIQNVTTSGRCSNVRNVISSPNASHRRMVTSMFSANDKPAKSQFLSMREGEERNIPSSTQPIKPKRKGGKRRSINRVEYPSNGKEIKRTREQGRRLRERNALTALEEIVGIDTHGGNFFFYLLVLILLTLFFFFFDSTFFQNSSAEKSKIENN